MVDISAEVITQYLTDSVNKEITIETLDPVLEDVNYYTGDIIGSKNNMISAATIASGANVKLDIFTASDESTSFENCVEWSYCTDHDYLVIDLQLKVEGTLSVTTGKWVIEFVDTNGNTNTIDLDNDDISEYSSVKRVELSHSMPSTIDYVSAVYFEYTALCSYTNLSVSEAELQVNFTDTLGHNPKYYRAPDFSKFNPNKTGWTIDNDNLLYEDFTLTESLCSQDNLKFGLCESAHCEFSEVGIDNPYIGQKIKPSINLSDYHGGLTDDALFAINWVTPVPLGSAATSSAWQNWVQITDAYRYCANWGDYINDLGLSDKKLYTEWKIKLTFNSITGTAPTYFKYGFFTRINGVGTFFTDSTYYETSDYMDYDTIGNEYDITTSAGTKTQIYAVYLAFYDANKHTFNAGDVTGSITINTSTCQYRIADSGHSMPEYSGNDLYVANGTLDNYLTLHSTPSRIPLGEFAIASISNEYKHNVIKKKITAYDDLVKLEDNAADWYTRYMFGVNTDTWTSNGFEYARQIFSTYWSYVSEVGLDSTDNYDLTTVATFTDDDYKVTDSTKYKSVSWSYQGNNKAINYGVQSISISDPSLYYRVTYGNFGDYTDAQIMSAYYYGYVESVDALGRGFGTNGGVLIEEYKTGANTPYNRLCVNRGDFFTLSSETASIKVVLPSGAKGYNICLIKDIVVESAIPRQTLTNGNLRLCYYNYGTKAIFACDSSITGRDVVRSLLEVCGCFFRLDRLNGLPEFVYPTKGGLYPSNTLLPADDLYPRHGTDQIYAMGRYISVTAEDYTVKDFGRIQILKNVKSSDTKSVVEWQYEGDPNAENTYIIDDNIFYCAEEMEYDYGNMPEVSDMLAGMYSRINNMGYVPNVTQALGAPWLECGDRVGLLTFNGGFETFIFRRTLKGIQNLRDTYESEGDEINNAINDFGYSIYSV